MTTSVSIRCSGDNVQAVVHTVGPDGAFKGDKTIIVQADGEQNFGVGNGDTLTITETALDAAGSGDEDTGKNGDGSGGDEDPDQGGDPEAKDDPDNGDEG